MVTINNTDDFIRALRQNPEFHAAARRELLTEELLALPQRLSQYAEGTDKRLDRVDSRLDSLENGQRQLQSDVKDLQHGQRQLQSDVKDLQHGQRQLQSDVKDLKQGQQQLEGRMRRVENQVYALRGDALETKMPTKLCDMMSESLDLRRLQIFWMARQQTPPMSRSEQFVQTLENATDNGTISDTQEGRITRTDLIVRSVRESDGSRLWIAVEASGVIDQDDIERARQSALALQKIYGENAIPAVYGYRISDQQREQAVATPELQQVHIFLEHDEASDEQ